MSQKKKRIFLFLTPDGITFSSPLVEYPDVDNFQVLGHGEGFDEESAFEDFIQNNEWVLNTGFKEVICLEVKTKIHHGKTFFLRE